MKNYFNPLAIIILLPLFFSCKNEAPISYAEAIAALKPDTITHTTSDSVGKMTFFNHYDLQGIVGAQLPPFEAALLTGDTINENYFDGKVSVINFWFIGCQPCEAEIPGFNLLADKYKKDPVNFLAISRNSPQDLNEFFTKHPFRVDQVPFGHSIIQDTFKSKWGYPLTIVADKDQKIIMAFSGGSTDSLAVQEIQERLIPVIDGALAKG